MTVAIFLQNLNSGGAEKIMVEFINHLCENTNHHVKVIIAEDKGPYRSRLNPNAELICLNKSSSLQAVIPLIRYLRSNKVDYLFSTLRNANLISLLSGKILGIKVIIREANSFEAFTAKNKNIKDSITIILCKLLYKYCHTCIAISQNVKTDLLKFSNCPEYKIKVIYNPVISIHSKDTIQIDPSYFHVGIVGRLNKQKNIATFVRIIEKFLTSKSKVIFHFFGEGEEQIKLERLISKFPYTQSIQLHGFDLSYLSQLRNMQLFMHLPIWEGLGNSVLEAFNSGVPMILSNVDSGYSELIFDSDSNVHFVDPTDDIELIIDIINKYQNKQINIAPNRRLLELEPSFIFNKYSEIIK